MPLYSCAHRCWTSGLSNQEMASTTFFFCLRCLFHGAEWITLWGEWGILWQPWHWFSQSKCFIRLIYSERVKHNRDVWSVWVVWFLLLNMFNLNLMLTCESHSMIKLFMLNLTLVYIKNLHFYCHFTILVVAHPLCLLSEIND